MPQFPTPLEWCQRVKACKNARGRDERPARPLFSQSDTRALRAVSFDRRGDPSPSAAADYGWLHEPEARVSAPSEPRPIVRIVFGFVISRRVAQDLPVISLGNRPSCSSANIAAGSRKSGKIYQRPAKIPKMPYHKMSDFSHMFFLLREKMDSIFDA